MARLTQWIARRLAEGPKYEVPLLPIVTEGGPSVDIDFEASNGETP